MRNKGCLKYNIEQLSWLLENIETWGENLKFPFLFPIYFESKGVIFRKYSIRFHLKQIKWIYHKTKRNLELRWMATGFQSALWFQDAQQMCTEQISF